MKTVHQLTNMPIDWELKNLGSIAKVKGGKRLPIGHQFAESLTPYPYIRVVDFFYNSIHMNDLKYLMPKTQKMINRYVISQKDVYISIAGTIGLVGIIPKNLNGGNLTENAAKITEIDNSIENEYLMYFLDSDLVKKQISRLVGITTQPKLALERIEQIEVAVPVKQEQQKIVTILTEIKDAIEESNRLINKYKCLKHGLMQDLFHYGIDEKGQIRSEKTHLFKDSPLGRIPEEWNVCTLLEGIGNKNNQIVAGPFGSNLKVSDYKKEGIPILRLQNIDTNKFIDKDIKYISSKKAKELEYHSFVGADIALAKLGDPVGKTCLIPDSFKFGIVVSDVVRIRVNKQYADKYFVVELLNSYSSRNQLYLDVIGTTRPRVNLTKIRNLTFAFPNKLEQEKISSLLVQAKEAIENEELYKAKLISLKRGLMDDLLSGKVRVNKLLN